MQFDKNEPSVVEVAWALERCELGTYFSMMNERHFGLDRQSSLQPHKESTTAKLKERFFILSLKYMT